MRKSKLLILFVIILSAANAKASDDGVLEPLDEVMLQTVTPDSVSVSENDTLSTRDKAEKKGGDYWKRQLMKGKLDLYDPTIDYPSFLQTCVNVYRWGDKAFNSYDNDYVVGTGMKCKAFIKNEEWLDSYALKFPRSTTIGMLSSVSPNIGAYVSYMAVSLGYSVDINKLLGRGKGGLYKWEFQFSCSLLAAELYYTSNSGGTNIHHFGDYADGRWFTEKFPGLKASAYGADIYYFFNHKKYSQGAAYSFSKYQKKSAGSVIAGVTISNQNVRLNFENLDPEIRKFLPSEQNIYNFNYNDYCFLLGYGYNWVFKPNWVFNISALPSIGFKHCFNDNVDGYGNIFSANIKGKIGLVYNHKKFFYGLSAKMDGHWYKSKNYSFFNSVESLLLTAGFRFDIF